MSIKSRNILASIFTLAVACLLSSAAFAAFNSQAQLQKFAQETRFQFDIVSNYASDEGSYFESKIWLDNDSEIALPAGKADWEIYFHFVRRVETTETVGLSIAHIHGDLHVMKPTKAFKGLRSGERIAIPFKARAHIASYGEMMPRAFITQKGLKAEVFANTDVEDPKQYVVPLEREEQYQRFKGDLYPVVTAASRYEDNLAANKAAADIKDSVRIIPTPKSMKVKRGTTTLDNQWIITYAGGLTSEANYLKEQLALSQLNVRDEMAGTATTQVIHLAVDSSIGAQESYQLVVDKAAVTITGSDSAGVFYGVQSLLGLIPADANGSVSLPRMQVNDEPRFSWRGMHYDMARNFHGKEATLKLIEQMGRYKLNKLHMHLTEDEGWRIEIPGLPELTDVGASRCFDLSETSCLLTQLGSGPHKNALGDGYYTREDFIEIIRFAAARHIEVIPEIDMPGHSRAVIKSMEARYKRLMAEGKPEQAKQFLLSDPQDQSVYMSVQSYSDNALNVCMPSTYAFIEKVVYELQQMYRAAGAQLTTYHMGGDEVGRGAWTASPACQALIDDPKSGVAGVADLKPYFVKKVAQITHERGMNLVGWEDGLMYDPNNTFNRETVSNKQVIANAWDNIWEAGVADRAHRLANNGYQVILSPATHLYFDHPYEVHPEELGYYWATRYSDVEKVFGFMPDDLYANADRTHAGAVITDLESLVRRPLPALEKPDNVLGLQGQLWGETVRSPAALEKMIFPRIAALAERAWHKAEWEGKTPDKQQRLNDYAGFLNYLTGRELPKLARAQINFYLPPPGAVIKDGKLFANTSLPNLVIEVSSDAGKTWSLYQQGQAASANTLLRSRFGERVSRTSEVKPL